MITRNEDKRTKQQVKELKKALRDARRFSFNFIYADPGLARAIEHITQLLESKK
jgi:hypothetical protein